MKKHYFLAALLVVYQKDKLERTKALNVLIPSETQTVSRPQLGRAQQQAQVRYFTEFDPEQKTTIVDVFIQSISHLGEMTEQEFHGEFYVDPNAPQDGETVVQDNDLVAADEDPSDPPEAEVNGAEIVETGEAVTTEDEKPNAEGS